MRAINTAGLFAAALAGLAACTLPANAQGLTRIETNAFYGATVTIEQGVRVHRPLPPTSHMVINPGGRTPVALSFIEATATIHADGQTLSGSGEGVATHAGSAYGHGAYPGFYRAPPRNVHGLRPLRRAAVIRAARSR